MHNVLDILMCVYSMNYFNQANIIHTCHIYAYISYEYLCVYITPYSLSLV